MAQVKERSATNRADAAVSKMVWNITKSDTMMKTLPLTKLGMVFAAVDRILVPNCSAAMVTKIAQYPVDAPNKKQ